jgi:glutathione S-transferase
MDDLILHHYAGSPFAEKVRLMLGFKGLPWRSVTVPAVMPKPDLLALTGGYRRTPNLQIGADIYCDSALVARVLEARQPSPTLYPAAAPLAATLAQWADTALFWTVIPFSMRPETLPCCWARSRPRS